MTEAHRQENLRRRIEAQQALPKANALRSREYGPPREETEVDPRDEEPVEVPVEEMATAAKTTKRKPPLQNRVMRNDLAELSPAE